MPRREATVQGELHAGETDKRALLERGLEAYDAVLVEGRSPTLVVEDLTVGYATFLMGYVTLVWVQAAVGRTRERVAGRTDLREAAERAGADYHDRIDADTATVYELVPGPARYLLGAWLVGVLAMCVLVGVTRPLVAGFTLSMPYIYTTLAVVFVKYVDSGRASHMADATHRPGRGALLRPRRGPLWGRPPRGRRRGARAPRVVGHGPPEPAPARAIARLVVRAATAGPPPVGSRNTAVESADTLQVEPASGGHVSLGVGDI